MDEDRFTPDEVEIRPSGGSANRWPWVAPVLVGAIAVFTFGFALHEWRYARQLTKDNEQLSADLSQTRGEMDALNSRLNALSSELSSQQAQLAASEAKAAPPHHGARARASGRRPEDSRWKRLQAQIADQQKELAQTRQDLAQTRSELEGSISSTRQDLSGEIAKNHDELVALEKRGERNYYEFDLAKSKQFQRVGPVSLSLRKVNTKHQNYNVEVRLNDAELSKKNVSLYEPVWFYSDENPHQGLELVVNRIEKNRVHGYVSAPKYSPAELASVESTPSRGVAGTLVTGAKNTGSAPSSTPALERRAQPLQ